MARPRQWTTKSVQSTGASTDVAAWTPAAGKKVRIRSVQVSVGVAASEVRLSFGNDAAGTRFCNPQLPINGNHFAEFGEDGIAGGVDEVVRLSVVAATATGKVVLEGAEE